MSVQIVSRTEWGANPPLWTRHLDCPTKNIFIEYTKRNSCSTLESCLIEVKYLQKFNLRLNGNPDIRYNFLIGGDGSIFEGRGWWACPRLPRKYEKQNRNSMYFGLIGQFDENSSSDAMFEAKHDLIKYAVSRQYLVPKFLEFTIGMAG